MEALDTRSLRQKLAYWVSLTLSITALGLILSLNGGSFYGILTFYGIAAILALTFGFIAYLYSPVPAGRRNSNRAIHSAPRQR